MDEAASSKVEQMFKALNNNNQALTKNMKYLKADNKLLNKSMD